MFFLIVFLILVLNNKIVGNMDGGLILCAFFEMLWELYLIYFVLLDRRS